MKKAVSILALVTVLLISGLSSGCSLLPNRMNTTGDEASATIGPAGGTVQVLKQSSPLYGVEVSIPKGALEEDVEITVNVAEQEPSLPEGLVQVGNGVRLGPEGTVFQIPVSITIRYVDEGIDESTFCAWEYELDASSKIVAIASIDTDQNTVRLESSSFSDFFLFAAAAWGLPPLGHPRVFDPAVDGLTSPNMSTDNFSRGVCYGEVAFVQWFWKNKKSTDGDLTKWHKDEHLKIANMAFCTTRPENAFYDLGIVGIDKKAEVAKLKECLDTGEPQIVGLALATDNAAQGFPLHAVLAYEYTTTGTPWQTVRFSVYDPNRPLKDSYITYDGIGLQSPGYEILGMQVLGEARDPGRLEFVYEFFKTPPEITKTSPTGTVDERRPKISATIHYPFIDKGLTSIQIDGTIYQADKSPVVFQPIDRDNATVSFTPLEDLSPGPHTVRVSASSVYSQGTSSSDPKDDCASAKEESWDFSISGGETWKLTLQLHLPAWYMKATCIEIHSISADYEAPGGEMDLDIEQMGAPAWVSEAWSSMVDTSTAVPIPVTRDGNDVSGSFEFIHAPTGGTISADLHGTIVGDRVSFEINYHVPPEVQSFSMPRNYSDEMSEWTGTVYYSIPSQITVSYEGTMTASGDQKTIEGTFTTIVGGQCARYRFHEMEYSYGWGYGREELLFDGITELTFSNIRFHGDFAVSIEGSTVT
jgi:hypothetical protein